MFVVAANFKQAACSKSTTTQLRSGKEKDSQMHVSRLHESVHEIEPPEGARKNAHGREAVQMQLERLLVAIREKRWIDQVPLLNLRLELGLGILT